MITLLKTHSFFTDKYIESCVLLENQGYCNENYLVTTKNKKYIVRKLLREDIDRNLEWEVLMMAFKKGITAEALLFDVEQGFMVFSFLEGKHKNTLDKNDLRRLAKTLQIVHVLKIEMPPIELDIKNKSTQILEAFRTLEKYKNEYVLCHNDLNPQNIFFTNKVKLIDWEYAGVNDRYFDLACVCVEFELDDEMQNLFVKTYFKDEVFTLDKLKAYKVIYKALCEEWLNLLTV